MAGVVVYAGKQAETTGILETFSEVHAPILGEYKTRRKEKIVQRDSTGFETRLFTYNRF
jgi:hypothetical protein